MHKKFNRDIYQPNKHRVHTKSIKCLKEVEYNIHDQQNNIVQQIVWRYQKVGIGRKQGTIGPGITQWKYKQP